MKKINVEELASRIGPDTFISYYKTHSRENTMEHFNLSSVDVVVRLSKFLGFKKTQSDIVETRQRYVLENYGSEEEYQKMRGQKISSTRKSCGDSEKLSHQENFLKSVIEKHGSVENFYSYRQQKIRDAWENMSDEAKANAEKKRKETCLERYGVQFPSQLSSVRQKRRENIEMSGISYKDFYNNIFEKARKTNIERYGVENAFQNRSVREKVMNTCEERYGVPYACMRQEARAFTNDSKVNRQFAEKLENLNIEYEREFRISKFSYDFRVGNTLIEINPFATHNSTWGIHGKPKMPNYHLNKTLTAHDAGYGCVHVWDWDDLDKVLNMLIPPNSIYARGCVVHEIDTRDAMKFLSTYHIQGICKSIVCSVGLFQDGDLISVMSFGSPRYNKNYQWELLRYCTAAGARVVGGASKLFSHFIDLKHPETVISYCDNSKFTGNVYRELGFNLISNGSPSKHWYNTKTGQHITDNLLRSLGADKLIGTHFGKGSCNEDILLNNNFVCIYDCGQSTYVYK